MSLSKVDVCNTALARLGQDVRIASMSEQTKHAKALNVAWDRVLDYVLADGVWPFAVKHVALAVVAETAIGWQYRYDYPSDCLNALALCDENGVRQYRDMIVAGQAVNGPEFDVQYGTQGQSIVTDQADAYLIYGSRVEDTGRFPAPFVEAMACRLALDIAPVVAAELGIRMGPTLKQAYEDEKARAQAHGFNESNERMTATSSPTLVARGFTGTHCR